MKKSNIKLFTLLVGLFVFLSVPSFGQHDKDNKTESKKRVVIVKKIKDKNGKVTVKRIEKTGEEAAQYLKDMKKGDNEEIIDVDVRVNIEGGKKGAENVRIIELDDISDLPDDVKEKLKDMDLNLDAMDSEDYQIITIPSNDRDINIIDIDRTMAKRLSIQPNPGIKVETIDMNVNDDLNKLKIKMDGQSYNFEWEGEIPDATKKEIEDLGFKVSYKNLDRLIRMEKRHFHKKMKKHHKRLKRHHKKMLMINPSDEIKDKVENMNINADGENYTIDIDMDGQKHKFEWEGEIPADTKKELEDLGFEVGSMSSNHSNNIFIHKGMPSDRPFLGIMMGDKKSDLGVLVDDVVEGSAAEEAGLQSNDIITSLNGTTVKKIGDVIKVIKGLKIGDELNINYIRGENTNTTKATLKAGKSEGKSLWINDEEIEFDFDSDNFKIQNDFDFEFDFDENMDVNIFENEENFTKKDKVILGIYPDNGQKETGVIVLDFVKDAGAKAAGLEKGDLIQKIDNQPVLNSKDIGNALKGKKEGDVVKVTYIRDGKEKSTSISLSKIKSRFPNKIKHSKVIIIRKSKEKGEEEKEIVFDKGDNNNRALQLEEVKVFPNPTTDQITVQFKGEATPMNIVVRDVSGREIYKEEVKNFDGNYDKMIDVKEAAAGLLIVTIVQNEQTFNIKVLKN